MTDSNASPEQWAGAQIQASRQARGWSQRHLAAQAGVAPNTVVRVEGGLPVRPMKLRALLDALGIELERPAEDEISAAASDVAQQWVHRGTTRTERRRRLMHLTNAMADYRS